MSSRISDVHYKTFVSTSSATSNDKIQLSTELPSPTCWLRGVQLSFQTGGSLVVGGSRFDFLTSESADPTDQADILLSFPVSELYGTVSFLLPEDSYIEITDSELWVTSIDVGALDTYLITLYYT